MGLFQLLGSNLFHVASKIVHCLLAETAIVNVDLTYYIALIDTNLEIIYYKMKYVGLM